MNLTGNTILITGGTSGIGRGLAEALHARGNKVIIAGRRQELLDEITAANPGMVGLPLDVEDGAALEAFAAQVRERFPELNALFNIAGISKAEEIKDGKNDQSVTRSMIETNITSVLHLTALLLPTLQAQPQATILATTSGLAFMPLAGYPTYCATKAFLHSWLQSLRWQLRDSSIQVLELVPPYVQTELSGPEQATDPNAMPLDDYIAEVMQLLEDPNPPRDEILVERAKQMRFAEQNGQYDEIFTASNSRG